MTTTALPQFVYCINVVNWWNDDSLRLKDQIRCVPGTAYASLSSAMEAAYEIACQDAHEEAFPMLEDYPNDPPLPEQALLRWDEEPRAGGFPSAWMLQTYFDTDAYGPGEWIYVYPVKIEV